MEQNARLFVGIELSDGARAALGIYRGALSAVTAGKLVDPALYHLTLNFLGQVPRGRVPELCALLDSVDVPDLTLSLGELGTFKGGSIFWIGIASPPPALFALQRALADALNAAGFPVESGEYAPHITIGRRVRLSGDPPGPPRASFTASHITLFESTRVDDRLTYLPLHRAARAVSGLSHITFIVRDLERSAALFEHVLGARRVYASGDRTFSIARELFLMVGDIWMCLMEGEPAGGHTYDHVAFRIAEADYDERLRHVRESGAELLPGRDRVVGEGRSIYFRDFDGHLFELHTGTLAERLARYAAREDE